MHRYIEIVAPRIYILIMLFFAAGQLPSQNVTIRGKAHSSYAGKIIQLSTLSDFITTIDRKEDADTIGTDGYFELLLQTDYTQPVFLKIDNVVARLYVQPDFVYGITIPEIDPDRNYHNDAELNVNIGIIGNDTTELNVLIFDYDEQFNNMFSPEQSRFLSKQAMIKRADSLQKICLKRYNKIPNEYFKNFLVYAIASINANVSRSENVLVNGLIINQPVQYHHYEYMQFFNACFSGYLNVVASGQKGQSLFNIINERADYKTLVDFLKNDKFLKNDTIRELVIIKNLWDFYFSPDFNKEGITSIVTQLNQQTKNREHRQITNTMLLFFNKMQPGSPAPGFSARTKTDTRATLESLKGHWIYLNFFSTGNTESLKEMPKIMALKKKFGNKVSFVSICLGDSLKAYKSYLRANPKFDWAIWYDDGGSGTRNAKESYFVTGTEAYFLINNSGYLAQSPALSPSKGIENKFNILFTPGKKKTKTGIR